MFNIQEVEQIMILMKQHKINYIKMGDMEINKTIHDPTELNDIKEETNKQNILHDPDLYSAVSGTIYNLDETID